MIPLSTILKGKQSPGSSPANNENRGPEGRPPFLYTMTIPAVPEWTMHSVTRESTY